MARVRADPPRMIAGRSVVKFTDWLEGDAIQRTDLVELELAPTTTDSAGRDLEARLRICIRPSGTEPKAKIYLEATMPHRDDLGTERLRLRALLDAVAEEASASLFPPE